MNDEITVYTKPDCMQCTATYRALEKLGIAFRLVNVSEDEEALATIKSLGYASVPVVVSPTGHWAGFRPDRIKGIQRPKGL